MEQYFFTLALIKKAASEIYNAFVFNLHQKRLLNENNV
jgi:hypothetical protein